MFSIYSDSDCGHQLVGGFSAGKVLPQDLNDTCDDLLPHDLEDTKCRLWKLEQDTNVQITKLKDRLRENVSYWWDTLQAPTPVLDWI